MGHHAFLPFGRTSRCVSHGWGACKHEWRFWGVQEVKPGWIYHDRGQTNSILQKRANHWAPDSQWIPKATHYWLKHHFSNIFVSLPPKESFRIFFSYLEPCLWHFNTTDMLYSCLWVWPFRSAQTIVRFFSFCFHRTNFHLFWGQYCLTENAKVREMVVSNSDKACLRQLYQTKFILSQEQKTPHSTEEVWAISQKKGQGYYRIWGKGDV